MKGTQRSGIRKYRKSELPRFRWTPELHELFVEAVERLGGKYRATPKRILQMMGVKGLRISHIKSHLQMHRNAKYENNIDAATKHLQTKRAQHGDDDIEILSICSSGRPDDLREPECKRWDNCQILVDASNGLQLANDDDTEEDSGTSLHARISNGEDNNDEEMNETCELSLFTTVSSSLGGNTGVQGFLPLADDRGPQFSSRNTVIHIPEFHSFGSTNINLDLTI